VMAKEGGIKIKSASHRSLQTYPSSVLFLPSSLNENLFRFLSTRELEVGRRLSMRISSIRIQNFRAFKDQTISFDDYTCLVGANGAGKSTVLYALKVFFRDDADSPTDFGELEDEDFHGSDVSQPVTITVVFSDLSDEAQSDFADYYRQGQLVVNATATYDPGTESARVVQHGQRTGIGAFRPFFEAEKAGEKVNELKEIYGNMRETYSELPPPGTKQKMIEALRSYEEDHPELTELIASEDQFYGFSRGTNLLAKYLQWVFVPAVKDASSEQLEARDTALGKLLARTVRSRINFAEPIKELRTEAQEKYQELLAGSQSALDDISSALKNRLAEWAHPDASLKLEWRQDPEKSVRVEEPFAQIIAAEGPFTVNLARFGHGLQRSYLLALLQELSGGGSEGQPRLILACEEPELYQHPPQARHMAQVLQQLSRNSSQVVVSTHSPYFVAGRGFENVRVVRKIEENTKAQVSHLRFGELAERIAEARGEQVPDDPRGLLAKIHQALQPALNEILFTKVLILVEGLEDVAYITTYLNLLEYSDEIRRLGCQLVQTNGKSHMIQPLAIAKHMKIPTFAVFDSDGHLPDRNGSRKKHEKDNLCLLRLVDVQDPQPFPAETLWDEGVVMWSSEMGTVVSNDFDPNVWEDYRNKIRRRYGHVGGLEKNSLFIADLLESALNDGNRSVSLERLCGLIMKFAANNQ